MSGLWWLRLAATLVAVGTLTATFALQSHWQWTPAFIACALWSWYGRRFSWAAAPAVGAAAFVLAAIVGVWSGIAPVYMLLVITGSLWLWDLDGLERRIGSGAKEAGTKLIEAHLIRFAEAVIAGWAAAGIALAVELRLEFGWVFALGLVLAFSLGRAFRLMRFPSTEKVKALGYLAAAILALILLSAALPQLQFHAGHPFRLPDVAPGAGGNTAFASGIVDVFLLILRAILALAAVGLPIYIVISLLTSEGRRRLLGDVIAMGLIVLALSLLTRHAQPPQDQKLLLQGSPTTLATPTPIPPSQFAAQVPPWLDVLAAPLLAILISGIVAAILWRIWRRPASILRDASDHVPEPQSRDTLERVAEQAQATIGALRAGEAFGDVITRSYVQLTRVVREERAIQRERAMTPYEFEQLLIRRGFPVQPVRDLTRLFEAVRYGRRTAGETEEQKAIASLEAIVAFCERSGGS